MGVTLTVQHHIFLTKEERYALHSGEPQEVVGYSIPVWTYGEHINSEPAREIFCRYYLYNNKADIPIKMLDDGYEIYLPHKIPVEQPEIENEEWRKMNEDQLESYYKMRENTVTSQNLLDIKDGGSGVMMYREHNTFEKNDTEYKIIHFVQVSAFEQLTDSIDYSLIRLDNLEELTQDEE